MPLTSDIRLLQILVGEEHGGAERFFVKLAIALRKAGIQQKLVIKADKARVEELASEGCDVVGLHFGGGVQDFAARWALREIVREFRPTVALAWMNRAARRMPTGPFSKIGRFGGYYPTRYYRKCDWIVCNTPGLVQHAVEAGWPAERVRMISNFGEMTGGGTVSRRDLDTADDAFVMLAAGRLHPSKGFDVAIRALPRVPGGILWIAGTGNQEEPLRSLAQSEGVADRVRFLGWRNDQSALLDACDVCIVPSRHEPLSNVILEAWTQAVPVVAAASEGPSWLLADGRGGILVPVDDAGALASAIQTVQEQPEIRQRLAAEGRAKWERDFSRDVIVAQYIGLFQEAMAVKTRR